MNEIEHPDLSLQIYGDLFFDWRAKNTLEKILYLQQIVLVTLGG